MEPRPLFTFSGHSTIVRWRPLPTDLILLHGDGLLAAALESSPATFTPLSVCLAAERELMRLVSAKHNLRVLFSGAYGAGEAGLRLQARALLRQRLLRDSRLHVDDHELLVESAEALAGAGAGAGARALRRRDLRAESFQRSGESGCVAHMWDESFREYVSTVRPSALLMFCPSGSAAPGGAAAAATALLEGEAHYALRMLELPVFLLSSSNPMRADGGGLFAFVMEAERVHAAPTEVARIVAAHARLAELQATPRAQECLGITTHLLDAADAGFALPLGAEEAVAAPAEAAAGAAAAGAAAAGAAAAPPPALPVPNPTFDSLEWFTPDLEPRVWRDALDGGAGSGKEALPLWHRLTEFVGMDIKVREREAGSEHFAKKARVLFPWDPMRQQRYVQKKMFLFQESKISLDIQRASLVGGPVAPMHVYELGERCDCPLRCPQDVHEHILFPATSQKARFPLQQSRRQWEGLSSNYKENLEKRRFKALALECCRYDPLTLPWGRAARMEFDPLGDAEARAHDLLVAMRLQEAYQAKYRDAAARENPSGKGAGVGDADDMFEGSGGDAANPDVGKGNESAAAAAEAYYILERILREFAPSLFSGTLADGIEPAAWPWDNASVEVCVDGAGAAGAPMGAAGAAAAGGGAGAAAGFVWSGAEGGVAPKVRADTLTHDAAKELLMRLLELGVNDALAQLLAELYMRGIDGAVSAIEAVAEKKRTHDQKTSLKTYARVSKDVRDMFSEAHARLNAPLSIPRKEDQVVLGAAAVPFVRPRSWSFTRFQLAHMGPFMPRPIGHSKDPRVPFRPDDWQRDLLSAVDARRSSLIIAPTSSGKTFIAYYAMQQTLEMKTPPGEAPAVCVYVAPSAALVQQVVDEAMARFKKGYARCSDVKGVHPGVLAGTYDSKYHIEPQDSQIVCCEPGNLEALLGHPKNAAWAARVKWVIFDEVHSVGSAGTGKVWERLLLSVDCPILALSATVGEVALLQTWLEGVEARRGRELVTIKNNQRWNALSMSVWVPRGAPAQGRDGGGEGEGEAAAEGKEAAAAAAAALRSITSLPRAPTNGYIKPSFLELQGFLAGARAELSAAGAAGATAQLAVEREAAAMQPCEAFALAEKAKADLALASSISLALPAGNPNAGKGLVEAADPFALGAAAMGGGAGTGAAAAAAPAPTATAAGAAAAAPNAAPKDPGLPPMFARLHPVAALDREALECGAADASTLTSSMTLLPEDSLQLFDALRAACFCDGLGKWRSEAAELLKMVNRSRTPLASLVDDAEMERVYARGGDAARACIATLLAAVAAVLGLHGPQSVTGAALTELYHSDPSLTRERLPALRTIISGTHPHTNKRIFTSAGARAFSPAAGAAAGWVEYAEAAMAAATFTAEGLTARLNACLPEQRFSPAECPSGRISSRQSEVFSGELLTILAQLAQCDLHAAQRVVQLLRAPLKRYMDWADSRAAMHGAGFLKNHMFALADSLKKAGKLPAIVFNLDRFVAENCANWLKESLVEKERKYRERSWAVRKVKLLEKLVELKDKLNERKGGGGGGGGEDGKRDARDHVRDSGEHGRKQKTAALEELDMVTAQLEAGVERGEDDCEPEFCFGGWAPGGPPTLKEMKEMFPKNAREIDSSNRFRLLRRGIAIHHNALPAMYLTCAMHFFRLGRVGLVFATDTLAQGINMPCRTVVLAGDNLALDSLLFRQMAGRAGRRGFDLRGDVVFFGLPSWRSLQLVTSTLPRLRPTVPLDAAFWATRMMQEAAAGDAGPVKDALAKSKVRLLKHDLCSVGKSEEECKRLGDESFKSLATALVKLKASKAQKATNSAGLLGHFAPLGASALPLLFLLQSGSLQAIVGACKAHSRVRPGDSGGMAKIAAREEMEETDSALVNVLARVVYPLPAFLPPGATEQAHDLAPATATVVAAAAAAAGGGAAVVLAEELARSPLLLAPVDPRGAAPNTPNPVFRATLEALAAIAHPSAAIYLPGCPAHTLLRQPLNPFLINFFAKKDRADFALNGVSDASAFALTETFERVLTSLGFILASRLVVCGVFEKDEIPAWELRYLFEPPQTRDLEQPAAAAAEDAPPVRRGAVVNELHGRLLDKLPVARARLVAAAAEGVWRGEGLAGAGEGGAPAPVFRVEQIPQILAELDTAMALLGLAARWGEAFAAVYGVKSAKSADNRRVI